jgi:hypothetical protein
MLDHYDRSYFSHMDREVEIRHIIGLYVPSQIRQILQDYILNINHKFITEVICTRSNIINHNGLENCTIELERCRGYQRRCYSGLQSLVDVVKHS